ncbi:hypothetical protein [Undibacterium sp. RuRC25W]|uniref:hypothetical protein n=1 Tax=Undibacterium sp. RuRC25W TaxID=3413047 RepID=UPI003BEFCEBD
MKRSWEDRFGASDSSIRAAQKAAKKQKKYRFHCYVPTRKEVATLSAELLSPLLIGWMCNSAMEVMPSTTQILDVIDILGQRQDATQFSRLVSMCHNYVRGD